jgi:hypothetical protein
MSHINGPQTMALTETKAKRTPYTVKPLATAPEDPVTASLRKDGDAAAAQGVNAYTGWLGTLQPAEKERVRPFHQAWSQKAKAADEPAPETTTAPVPSSAPPSAEPSAEPVEKHELPTSGFPGCGFCGGSGVELVKDANGERHEPCLSCFPKPAPTEQPAEGTAP